MRGVKIIAGILGVLGVSGIAQRVSVQTPVQEPAKGKRIVIAASTVLDGKGKVLRDARIVVEGEKIAAVETKADAKAAPADYDLRGLTVLPGWIDAHAHITWNFGKDGKNAGMAGTSLEDAYQSASNAWVTLMAGFTTIQSPGAANDIPLRDAIAKGKLAGPRILTAVEPLFGQGEKTGTPEEIRAFVRKQKQAGADVIKIFASQSIRQGGGMTLSQEQLKAACDEAKKQGLCTLVHAYKDAVRAATLAGCTEIEHGTLATDDDLKLMAEKGTYLDPQAGLVIENYLLHKEQYLGTPGYTAEGFAAMEKILPMNHELVQHAAKTPGLKVVFGTDAVAGAHGRNDGGDGVRQFVGGGSARNGGPDRDNCSRFAGRHHRAGWRSVEGHYGGAARGVRDEGRRGLQECFAQGDSGLCGRAAVGQRADYTYVVTFT